MLLKRILEEGHVKKAGMINSVNEEGIKCETIFPMIAETVRNVVGLTCDKDGIPRNSEKKIEIAKSIIDKADHYGMEMDEGGMNAPKAMEACQKGMDIVGSLFESGEYFVGGLIYAGELMTDAVEILKDGLLSGDGGQTTKARMILCTVKDDLHDIGKNIVRSMLEANGFDALDLGIDVPAEKVVETAKSDGDHQPAGPDPPPGTGCWGRRFSALQRSWKGRLWGYWRQTKNREAECGCSASSRRWRPSWKTPPASI